MEKIKINLLPPEYTTELLKQIKFDKVQAIGLASMIVVAFISSLITTFALIQAQSVKQAQARLNTVESQVNQLKDTQAQVLLLKNRLTSINKYLEVPSKQSAMYELMSKLLPGSANLGSMAIDRSGDVLASVVVSDASVVDDMFGDFLNNEKNENRIDSVLVENISLGKNSIYTLNFRIKTK